MNLKETIKEWLRYCRSPEIIAAEEKRPQPKTFEELKAKWEAERNARPTICKECEYYNAASFPFKCTSPEAPYTDFVTGHKEPKKINCRGHCKYFKQYEGQQPPNWRVI